MKFWSHQATIYYFSFKANENIEQNMTLELNIYIVHDTVERQDEICPLSPHTLFTLACVFNQGSK